jgi:hypothetical protein
MPTANADAGLFPLPLVPFEKYLLFDDRPAYPMTYCLEFDFRGEFDRPAFEAALPDALGRHPLLSAHVQRVRSKGLCWVDAAGARPPLDWNVTGVSLSCPGDEGIDLRREVGLRLWVRQAYGHSRLTIQVHHACADGIGGLQFVGDLLTAYAIHATADGNAPKLVPLDATALRDRGRFDVRLPESLSQWQIFKATAPETMRFLTRRPTPLAIPRGTSPSSALCPLRSAYSFAGICSHTFDAEQTEALRAVAVRFGATLNDVLLRDAFLIVDDWNRLHDPSACTPWLRINMPTNLRGRRAHRMPAANVMGYALLTRRAADCRDPAALLDGIRRETDVIRRWSVGLMFIDGLKVTSRIPGLLRFMTRRRRCLASLVLSNLGDPSRHFRTRPRDADGRIVAGNVVFERMTGTPPLRPLTRASMLSSCYAGELTVSLRCDPETFTVADAQSLLAEYVECLQETASHR